MAVHLEIVGKPSRGSTDAVAQLASWQLDEVLMASTDPDWHADSIEFLHHQGHLGDIAMPRRRGDHSAGMGTLRRVQPIG